MNVGGGTCFPFDLGGGDADEDVIHQALLDAYAPALSDDESQLPYHEAWAEAVLLASIWAADERLKGLQTARKTIDGLLDWEQACGLRPLPTDSMVERRNALAAKMRGLLANAEPDIRDACLLALGTAFEVLTTHDGSAYTYWKGGVPGPPGREWASDRAHINVKIKRDGLGADGFERMSSQLWRTLDTMLPAWMTFNWYAEDTDSSGVAGFVLGQSILGLHGL